MRSDARCSGPTSKSACTHTTRPTGGCGRTGSSATIRKAGGRALVGFVGVQSNQFNRAVDLARPFLAAGLPVCIGGFHVSGCIAMLPDMPKEMVEAQEMGISFFAGEAEDGRLDEVLRDAFNGALKPLYNHMDDLPALEGEPLPFLPYKVVRRTYGTISSIDIGRGCPYQCSFCTIINVQGRKSRVRSADDLERAVRESYAEGIKRFFITDDNLARNSRWEELFDRLIQMRVDEGMDLGFTIQVDTLCHKIPNFIEKATAAGVLPHLHRAREHQPRQPDRRQEAPEQDHRLPRDAAEVACTRRDDRRRLHRGLPG